MICNLHFVVSSLSCLGYYCCGVIINLKFETEIEGFFSVKPLRVILISKKSFQDRYGYKSLSCISSSEESSDFTGKKAVMRF